MLPGKSPPGEIPLEKFQPIKLPPGKSLRPRKIATQKNSHLEYSHPFH